MKILRLLLYILIILVLQTVVFSRLSFFGATPDLVLVSVIVFSIIFEREEALYFSLLAGFLQDILSGGWYINTLVKAAVWALIGIIKENFLGTEESLVVGLVLVFTPLVLLFQGGVFYLLGRNLSLLSFLVLVIFSTIYNLILTPILLPIIKKL